jgi:hypothetical protein
LRSRTTRKFRQLLAALPQSVRREARASYRQFRDNPRHPSLQFKKVHQSLPVYSARVTGDYRAVGVLSDDTIVWFFVGSHADYERLLRAL